MIGDDWAGFYRAAQQAKERRQVINPFLFFLIMHLTKARQVVAFSCVTGRLSPQNAGALDDAA